MKPRGAKISHLRGTMRRTLIVLPLAMLVMLTVLALPDPAAAQVDGQPIGAQTLRPYWHVFVAFALAWLLIFGWIFSVARRLTRLERKLGG